MALSERSSIKKKIRPHVAEIILFGESEYGGDTVKRSKRRHSRFLTHSLSQATESGFPSSSLRAQSCNDSSEWNKSNKSSLNGDLPRDRRSRCWGCWCVLASGILAGRGCFGQLRLQRARRRNSSFGVQPALDSPQLRIHHPASHVGRNRNGGLAAFLHREAAFSALSSKRTAFNPFQIGRQVSEALLHASFAKASPRATHQCGLRWHDGRV